MRKRATTGARTTKCAACWPTSLTRPRIRKSWNILARRTLTRRRSSNTATALRPVRQTIPWLLLDDAPLLTKLSALRRDRATGVEGATVAGLMFGRFEALRDALPGFHVDYRERLSDDPSVRWTDRVVPDGTWETICSSFICG